MNEKLLLLIFSIILVSGCKANKPTEKTIPLVVLEQATIIEKEDGVEKEILNANWKISTISEAIIYKYHNFDNLFNSIQSITIIDVDLKKDIQVDIPYVTSGFLKTSEAGTKSNATAAINGSYFNTSTGGSVVFFKKEDDIINNVPEDFTAYRENAGFAVDISGKLSVIIKPTDGWQTANARTLLTSGPLLVYDGKLIEQVDAKFNTNRHPRTAIGVTDKSHLIAVVVDGRNAQAHGMTTEELGVLMHALGCKEAMNLDGGGSSTAWVKNRGVVNYPSDNKEFDHEGERAVANVITFTQK